MSDNITRLKESSTFFYILRVSRAGWKQYRHVLHLRHWSNYHFKMLYLLKPGMQGLITDKSSFCTQPNSARDSTGHVQVQELMRGIKIWKRGQGI